LTPRIGSEIGRCRVSEPDANAEYAEAPRSELHTFTTGGSPIWP
jgi:hypothetical protein